MANHIDRATVVNILKTAKSDYTVGTETGREAGSAMIRTLASIVHTYPSREYSDLFYAIRDALLTSPEHSPEYVADNILADLIK